VFSCYTQLAQYFQSRRDNHTGVYFLEKCLEIARLTKDAVSEMLANHNLGLAHEQVGGSCFCCSSRSCSCLRAVALLLLLLRLLLLLL
jgi:hypothetical protein